MHVNQNPKAATSQELKGGYAGVGKSEASERVSLLVMAVGVVVA